MAAGAGPPEEATLPSSGEPPPLPADLAELTTHLQAIQQVLRQLAVLCYLNLQRPPVQLQVDRLEADRLEFNLGSIDVDQLSGELNIGLTHQVKAAPGEPPADVSCETEPPIRTIWPLWG